MLLALVVSSAAAAAATSLIMFQAAAKTFSVASTASVSRGILLSVRHYCKKTPTKLRVSDALSGAAVGAKVTVQVTSISTS